VGGRPAAQLLRVLQAQPGCTGISTRKHHQPFHSPRSRSLPWGLHPCDAAPSLLHPCDAAPSLLHPCDAAPKTAHRCGGSPPAEWCKHVQALQQNSRAFAPTTHAQTQAMLWHLAAGCERCRRRHCHRHCSLTCIEDIVAVGQHVLHFGNLGVQLREGLLSKALSDAHVCVQDLRQQAHIVMPMLVARTCSNRHILQCPCLWPGTARAGTSCNTFLSATSKCSGRIASRGARQLT